MTLITTCRRKCYYFASPITWKLRETKWLTPNGKTGQDLGPWGTESF